MACYKSALIDLDCRWANKGQVVFLEHPEEKYLKEISLDEFEIKLMELVRKYGQPERLRRVDTENSEAIVRSANIDEIAETSRND